MRHAPCALHLSVDKRALDEFYFEMPSIPRRSSVSGSDSA